MERATRSQARELIGSQLTRGDVAAAAGKVAAYAWGMKGLDAAQSAKEACVHCIESGLDRDTGRLIALAIENLLLAPTVRQNPFLEADK
jgi:hypothetical protein